MRFDWLDQEIAGVASQRFFTFGDPKSEPIADVAAPSPAYRAFVQRYGEAKLYRRDGRYLVQVYAIPRWTEVAGRPFRHFGRTDDTLAYFAADTADTLTEPPVFEWTKPTGLRQAYDDFESWLVAKCQSAKTRFSRAEWRVVREGAKPFTERERRIVAARKQFTWQVLGVDPDGDHRFEVRNGSEIVLPYLTLGVESNDHEPVGGIWLPVSAIGPGETGILKRGVYKGAMNPADIVIVDKPDPLPEERDRYWEFRL
jgi:hypothetical protein